MIDAAPKIVPGLRRIHAAQPPPRAHTLYQPASVCRADIREPIATRERAEPANKQKVAYHGGYLMEGRSGRRAAGCGLTVLNLRRNGLMASVTNETKPHLEIYQRGMQARDASEKNDPNKA
jgi:hypothetical protein